MADAPFQHLTVIGTGLIGGSFVMACREIYPNLLIRAVDRDAETLQYAVRNNLADRVSLTLPAEFEDNHLIVLATHLSSSLDILSTLAPKIEGRDILVTDIGSCKRAVCERGEALLPRQFVGGHPLAGKEFSGIRHATALLFVGKPYVLCPPARLDLEDFLKRRLEDLKRLLSEGLRAKVGLLDPGPHDRDMAFVSHFPQLYAVLLTNLLYRNEPGRLLAFHGAGIDDQLRLAASPYEMWRDVFALNEDNLRDVLCQFAGLLGEAGETLVAPPMAMAFERANTMYREFHTFRQQ